MGIISLQNIMLRFLGGLVPDNNILKNRSIRVLKDWGMRLG